mmetsp:Transcript_9931/g.12902  ORF Transcript_9931/g.12902 Transcript_9931/m.12902 type:complete len:159 (-) Transcript_9931:80-556(-)
MASFPIETESLDEFYVRYYVGHKGRFGHEFIEFELVGLSGKLRYANNSNYAGEKMIRKEVYVSPAVVQEVKRIVEESEITKEDDSKWKEPTPQGRQELEIKIGNEHIAFTAAEVGSLADINDSEDPEGLRIFYYLTMDLKSLMLSLISLHFKVNPIPR